jgi:hypothetical protein
VESRLNPVRFDGGDIPSSAACECRPQFFLRPGVLLSLASGGKTWWAPAEFTGIKIAAIIFPKLSEDAREAGATLAFVESNVPFDMTVIALTRLLSPFPCGRFLAKSSRFFAA